LEVDDDEDDDDDDDSEGVAEDASDDASSDNDSPVKSSAGTKRKRPAAGKSKKSEPKKSATAAVSTPVGKFTKAKSNVSSPATPGLSLFSPSIFGGGASARSANSSLSSSPLPAVTESTKKKLSMFGASATAAAPDQADDGEAKIYGHTSLDFLRPENIRDKERRRPADPDYNPRTLHVPDSFLNNQTPAQRQWWVLKADYYDVILFFKMGKFYELFHMDADVAVAELNIVYMKGEVAHAGFPEVAYGRYASTLVEKGYKVLACSVRQVGGWQIHPCDVVEVSRLALDVLAGRPHWLLTLIIQYFLGYNLINLSSHFFW
jgi:DNA mismatch repair protein MSH6